ncbi:ribosome modulation factor [Rubellimicrobium arenae]|uniref:ribosome modulation factor n=1 Tax=Rubellimicrobium arenae TaxID=2817372 RepID=UPI001B301C07|nr:hypothetical protein [Rubellimicrobium arenae]
MPQDNALDAWCKGYAAGRAGHRALENPYPLESKLAEVWARGGRKSQTPEHLRLPYFEPRRPGIDQ